MDTTHGDPGETQDGGTTKGGMSTSGADKQTRDARCRGGSRSTLTSEKGWECDTCTKVFTAKDSKLLECDYCTTRRCIKCVNITDAAYKQLGGRADFPWSCKTCVEKAMRAIHDERDIETRCQTFLNRFESETIQRLDSLKTEIDNIKTAIGLSNGATSIPAKVTNQPPTHHIVDKVCESIKYREQQTKNLVVFKAQETPDTTDREIVEALCTHTSGREITFTTKRLGKKLETNTEDTEHIQHSRPLLVSFNTEQDKLDVLQNSYKLRDADPPYNQLSIAQDMSPDERKKNQDTQGSSQNTK